MIDFDNVQHDDLSVDSLNIDLTPMLDVIFILLIFFILTANSVEHIFELNLPDETNGQIEAVNDDKAIYLEIYADEKKWKLQDDVYISWDRVKSQLHNLHAEKPDLQVFIAGDKHVSLQKLLQTLTFLKKEGLQTAQIVMQQDDI